MDRGAWRAIVHGVTKELDMTEQLNTHTTNISGHAHKCSKRASSCEVGVCDTQRMQTLHHCF